MITVISATNRAGSKSEVVASGYTAILKTKGAETSLFALKNLPEDFIYPEMYGKRSLALEEILDQFIVKAEKIVFVIPEYNGSYPGILKTFLDAAHPKFFRGKKAGIIGVSEGHTGNLRGQEHLTGVLHYMRMMVHFLQPKLSNIDKVINEHSEITDARTLRLLGEHADQMISF